MKTFLSSVILSTVLALSYSQSSEACSCAPIDVAPAVRQADVVALGRVVQVRELKEWGSQEVIVTVTQLFKGKTESRMVAYMDPMCGYDSFQVGRRFLVYARNESINELGIKRLSVGLCSRTAAADNGDASEDLEWLKQNPTQ